VAAYLRFDLFEGPGAEVGGAHPDLDSPEQVLDGGALLTSWATIR
jgi:hypothetical protein